MNKMDNFFKDKLTDYTPAEGGWNVPSDDLWNDAKTHFPKKKKSNRRALWFLFPFLLIGLCAGYYLTIDNESEVSLSEAIEATPSKTLATNEEKQVTNNLIKEDNNIEKEVETNSPESTRGQVEPEAKVIGSISSTRKRKNTQTSDVVLTTAMTNSSIIKHEKETTDGQIITPINSTVRPTDDTYTKSESLLSQQVNVISEDDSGVIPNYTLYPIAQIGSTKSILSVSDRQFFNYLSEPVLTEPTRAPSLLPMSELGMSYLLNPIVFILNAGPLEGDHPDDVVEFFGSYNNINLTSSRWLGKKWSVSSGIYYSDYDLTIDISVWDEVETEITDLIQANYSSSFNRSSKTNDNEDLTITVFDGFTLEEGDFVNLRLDAALDLMSVQIPFILNYHFYKKRFEYHLGAGAALDILHGEQLAIDVDVFKDDNYVAVGNQGRIEFTEWGLSLYTTAGMRYRISPNINLGLALRVSPNNLHFSGVEFGLNYRWNKGYR